METENAVFVVEWETIHINFIFIGNAFVDYAFILMLEGKLSIGVNVVYIVELII